jgi:dipeptidyl aminopeptidase/acylaminoacyl peptidase
MQAARDASPIFHIARTNPPLLILHGDSDQTVPLSDSQNLAKAMKEQGADAQLHILPGAGHGGTAFFTPEMQPRVTDFFRQSLQVTRR